MYKTQHAELDRMEDRTILAMVDIPDGLHRDRLTRTLERIQNEREELLDSETDHVFGLKP